MGGKRKNEKYTGGYGARHSPFLMLIACKVTLSSRARVPGARGTLRCLRTSFNVSEDRRTFHQKVVLSTASQMNDAHKVPLPSACDERIRDDISSYN